MIFTKVLIINKNDNNNHFLLMCLFIGNKEKAMVNYMGALAMFTQFENKKGMGICYNNIGNIHRARGEWEKAEELYSKAIEFGLILNDPPTIESQRSLSSRYNNLAMLYIYQPIVSGAHGGYLFSLSLSLFILVYSFFVIFLSLFILCVLSFLLSNLF